MEIIQERETTVTEILSAVRHTAVYGLGNVLAKALGFLMLPFYTHYLNPADYGILEILDLSMSLFSMFLTMGMTAAVLRCYAVANSQEEKKRIVSTAFVFVAVTGLAAAVLGLAAVRPVSASILGPAVPAKYLLLSFASFILSYVALLPRTYLRALEASGTFTLVDTLALCLMLVLNVYFVMSLKLGLEGILLSSVIAGGIQTVWLSIWAISRVGIHFRFTYLSQLLRFGWPLMFSNLAMFALNFSDRFFLQHLTSFKVVGIYAVGYKFGFMLNYLLVQPFYVMWQSRMYLIHAQSNHADTFRQIFVLYSLLLTFAGLVLSILSPEIIHVMVGPQFRASQDVIPIVVLAYVCWGIGFYAQTGMFLTNKTNLIGLIAIAAGGLNLVLNWVLIARYGMMGAAWATLLSFIAIGIGSYFVSERVFPLRLSAGRLTLAMTLATGLYLLSRSFTSYPLGIAIVAKVLLLISFPIFLWKLRILAPPDITILSETWNRTIPRSLAFLGANSRA